jgi:hypothetical protein
LLQEELFIIKQKKFSLKIKRGNVKTIKNYRGRLRRRKLDKLEQLLSRLELHMLGLFLIK